MRLNPPKYNGRPVKSGLGRILTWTLIVILLTAAAPFSFVEWLLTGCSAYTHHSRGNWTFAPSARAALCGSLLILAIIVLIVLSLIGVL